MHLALGRRARTRIRGTSVAIASVIATVVATAGVAVAYPHTVYEQQNASGHLFTTREAECMWMHVHISHSPPGQTSYKPYIYTRGTMDYAHRGWYGPAVGWQDKQCGDTGYKAPPFTMHIAEHLAVWAYWLNNWVWCNNGPEIVNSGFQHEVVTSWWWYMYPCQDIADSTWYFNRGYYRGDLSVGTVARIIQTPWLNAA